MDEAGTDGRFDVCNGDADGLCALRQWRLHDPAPAVLVTGLKRDIALLERVPPHEAREVLVCDIALQRNRAALERLLDAGAHVRWFDHHATGGELPRHEGLEAHIETQGGVCTSLLVDRHLDGRFRAWAVVGAYGDNLGPVADALATDLGLTIGSRSRLRQLGELINYNAYGESAADVCATPQRMHALMSHHADPLQLLEREPVFGQIARQRADDLARALSLKPARDSAAGRVTVLPDEPWSRRVIGSLANELVNARSGQPQAVLKALAGGGWMVSVRAPLARAEGAAELCSRFGGSGRAAAAGIERLGDAQFDDFVTAVEGRWGPGHPREP